MLKPLPPQPHSQIYSKNPENGHDSGMKLQALLAWLIAQLFINFRTKNFQAMSVFQILGNIRHALVRGTIAVIKHHEQKQVGEERVCSAHASTS